MMTRQELTKEWVETCRGHSDELLKDGKTVRAVDLFLQEMARKPDTADLVSTALRVEGLAIASRGKVDAVRSWLRKF